jgi:prepilin-type N-terminal cleavage/methylation domain-containing protein
MKTTKGISLIEVLIVVAIIGILIQLILPAIQDARELARRAACQNNLRQVGLALSNYESARETLPVGAYSCCCGTWMISVLPYAENAEIAKKFKYDPTHSLEGRFSQGDNLEVTGRFFPMFRCPSDKPLMHPTDPKVSKHNYVVNYGNTASVAALISTGGVDDHSTTLAEYQGVRFQGAPFYIERDKEVSPKQVKLADITDGLNHTLLASENVQTKGTDDRGMIWYAYTAGFSCFLSPNSDQPDLLYPSIGRCASSTKPNPPCKRTVGKNGPMFTAARSWHPGGVNALTGDNAVRFVADTLNLEIRRAISTT